MANLLQEDVKKSAEELGFVHRRFRDTIGKVRTGSPFDELVATNKCNLCLECKMLRERKSGKPKSFPFDNLSEVQREGLLEWSKMDINECYVLINFRWTDKSGKGEAFGFDIVDFLKIEQQADRKSISLDMCRELGIDIPRYGVGWDLRYLI